MNKNKINGKNENEVRFKELYSGKAFHDGTSNEDLMAMTHNQTNWILYEDLYKAYKQGKTLDDLMKNDGLIVMYEVNEDGSGHWTLITRSKDRNTYRFVDSYNYKPDQEFKFITSDMRKKYHETEPIVAELLLQQMRKGKKIEYNQMHLQSNNHNVGTCGNYASFFYNNRYIPLKRLQRFFKLLKDRHYNIDKVVYILSASEIFPEMLKQL